MKLFPKILTLDETNDMLNKIINQYKSHGFSYYKVVKKEDNNFIGICGLMEQNIDGVNEIEIGYRIHNSEWNKGYATEAANCCKLYAMDELKLKRIILLILQNNIPSKKVALKIGAKYSINVIFHKLEHELYEYKK